MLSANLLGNKLRDSTNPEVFNNKNCRLKNKNNQSRQSPGRRVMNIEHLSRPNCPRCRVTLFLTENTVSSATAMLFSELVVALESGEFHLYATTLMYITSFCGFFLEHKHKNPSFSKWGASQRLFRRETAMLNIQKTIVLTTTNRSARTTTHVSTTRMVGGTATVHRR